VTTLFQTSIAALPLERETFRGRQTRVLFLGKRLHGWFLVVAIDRLQIWRTKTEPRDLGDPAFRLASILGIWTWCFRARRDVDGGGPERNIESERFKRIDSNILLEMVLIQSRDENVFICVLQVWPVQIVEHLDGGLLMLS